MKNARGNFALNVAAVLIAEIVSVSDVQIKKDKNSDFFIYYLNFILFFDVTYLIKISLALALGLMEMSDKNLKKIIKILEKESTSGLTITELVKSSKLSRHIVLKTLAQLEGANKVSIRKAGMAKIYSLKVKSRGKK